jgi:hypothetical protein
VLAKPGSSVGKSVAGCGPYSAEIFPGAAVLESVVEVSASIGGQAQRTRGFKTGGALRTQRPYLPVDEATVALAA